MSQTVIIGKLCAAALFLEEKNLEVMASVVREAARALDSQWQPIETAPKDQVVLVYGSWAGEITGPEDGAAIYIANFGGRGDYEGYEWVCHGGDSYASWVRPTHWMPLPAAPSDIGR